VAERAVTISVSYPVAAGEEAEFEAWSRLRLAESADRPGYLGGQVLAPPGPGPDWYIVHRFANERAASSWEAWFRESAGWQQAADIEWKVEGPDPAGRPPAARAAAPNGRPVAGRVTPGRSADPRNGRGGRPVDGRAPVEAPYRPAVPPPVRPGPAPADGRSARPPRTPPRSSPVAVAAPGPPRQAGPPPAESRPRDVARPAEPAAPPPSERRPAAPARPAEPPAPGTRPSEVAPLVLTAAVVVLFTAVFETVVAPMLAGGPVLVRIVLLSVVISLAVAVVRPPGLRRWLANLLVPVAVRNRLEAEGRADDEPRR
jgi:hypothetical protein